MDSTGYLCLFAEPKPNQAHFLGILVQGSKPSTPVTRPEEKGLPDGVRV
jgi:hypothetical protein